MKQSLAHAVWECKYHIVWIPKRRQKVLYGKARHEVGRILFQLCKYKGVEVVEGKICTDHVHACLGIPPKYSVASIVGYLKGKSTMIVMERFSGLRKNFRGQQLWARGYYVSTVGLDEGRVRKYIQEQEIADAERERFGDEGNPFEGRK